MRAELYSLTFPQGLHVGAHGIGTESVRPTIPSDTLFSALVATWVRLGGDPAAWVGAFLPPSSGPQSTRPPFLLGSAYPRVADVLFYPRPLAYEPPDLRDDRKQWKRVQFVSEALFTRIRRGRSAHSVWSTSEEAKARQLLQGGRLLLAPEDRGGLPQEAWRVEQVPRVALDRVTSASNLFSVGRVVFPPGCGLWFAVAWLDPDRRCDGLPFREAFAWALDELCASGIGGDRSVGYGACQAKVLDQEVPWDDPRPGRPLVLLSRYHPRVEELPEALADAEGYQLEFLSGWGSSPAGEFRRRGVWFLAEGSLIRQQGGGVMGDLVDLAPVGEANPGHPVWRYGLALGLPWEVGDAQEN